MLKFWSVPREWPAQTVFIVCGGPSVADQNLELLRGRRVIVINSSVYRVPWADVLYFGDSRWWREPENKAAVQKFGGRVVTVSREVPDPKVVLCRKAKPPGLSRDSQMLMQKWTSLTAATNLAAHLIGPGGAVVWLGADGKKAADGRTHHHKPHRWPFKAGCYDRQRGDLETVVPALKAWGVSLFNASPDSALADLVPFIRLEDAVLLGDERRAA